MQWEYKLVELRISGSSFDKSLRDQERLLNGSGSEGWEAVNYEYVATPAVVLMKRPKP
jgi:hypothetical protein